MICHLQANRLNMIRNPKQIKRCIIGTIEKQSVHIVEYKNQVQWSANAEIRKELLNKFDNFPTIWY